MKKCNMLAVAVSAVLIFNLSPLNALRADSGISIDEEHFPDANFRYYLSHYVDNGDGSLSEQEIANTTFIYLNGYGIESLEGINYFTSLERLSFSDYSEDLVIDVSGLPTLRMLGISNHSPAYPYVIAGQEPSEEEAMGNTTVILNSYLSSVYNSVEPSQRPLPYAYWQEKFYLDRYSGSDRVLTWPRNTTVVTTVEMYRLYNPNSGEHFYTSDPAERDNLYSLGWNYEGIGWNAPAMSNTPVYRLYNQYGGEHHYTTSIAERDSLVAAGWTYERIGWYSDDARTVPLYRQYNPNAFANNHNYTTSLDENNFLVSLGWRAEDIGWYGVG